VVTPVSKYSDEERAKIIAEAYGHLERLEGMQVREVENTGREWRRREHEPKPVRETTDAMLARHLRGHVAQEVAAAREYARQLNDALVKEVGALVGELAKEFDATLTRLNSELGSLRLEIETLRANKVARDGAANVVDLPMKGAGGAG
jgi:hypothetical protein